MSQENVELVRRIYDAWDRGESARDFLAPDVEYVNPPYAVETGTRHGRKSFAVVGGTYEDFAIQVERFIDAGDSTVVVLARYTATGRGVGYPSRGSTDTSGPCAGAWLCTSAGSSRTGKPSKPPG